ncbi:MAG: apolipoprotein N-acyltransferase [Christensenella sp.]
MKIKNKQIDYLICAASGVFCALAFDISALAPFVWVGAVPMFFVLLKNNESTKKTIARAGVFALAYCFVYYAQIMTLDITLRVGNTAGLFLVLAWIGISLVHGAIFTAALTAGFRIKCHDALRAPLAAVLFTGAEWLIGAGVLGLPFLRLGITQWRLLPLTQSAAVFGVLFISFLIVGVGVLLAQGILYTHKKRAAYLCAACILFLANLAGGAIALNVRTVKKPDVSVAAVQMNVPFTENAGEGRFESALSLAEKAAKNKPDFIILPENSVYGSFTEDAELYEPCARIAEMSGGYVIVGCYGIHGFELRNSVFLVSPDGKISDMYHKQRLVPLFENGYEREFSLEDGRERNTLKTSYGEVGAMICFESLFSDIAADTAGLGAELLTVVTNDSWFAGDIPLTRHLAQSVLRAQETGKYSVQVGNNGKTAVVSPLGEITAELAPNTSAVLNAEVSFISADAPYVMFRDWWIVIAAAGVLAVLIYTRKKRN